MTGLLVCGVLQLIIAVVYDKNPGTKSTGRVIVALTSLYMFSYNVRSFALPVTPCILTDTFREWLHHLLG